MVTLPCKLHARRQYTQESITMSVIACRDEEQQSQMHRQLKRTIEENYKPLHSHLYLLEGWAVEQGVREAVGSGDQGAMRALLTEETPGND